MKKKIENKYPDGCVEIGFTSKNLPVGLWKTFYPNGKIKRIANYINGKKSGTWLTYLCAYDQTNDVEFISYKNNKREGRYIKYHPSYISCNGNYLNGKKQGQWFYYYGPKKILFKIENYNNDYLHGPIYTHRQNGELETIEEFECGWLRLKKYFHKKQIFKLKYFFNNEEFENINFFRNRTYESWTK